MVCLGSLAVCRAVAVGAGAELLGTVEGELVCVLGVLLDEGGFLTAVDEPLRLYVSIHVVVRGSGGCLTDSVVC